MIVRLQKGSGPAHLDLGCWSVAIHGNVVDERGKMAVEEVGTRARHVYQLHYDPINFEVSVNGEKVGVDEFEDYFVCMVNGSIVLEATTLGFVEILLCCRTLHRVHGIKFDIIYAEPANYRSRQRQHLLHRRDFELSDEVTGYRGIPGSTFFLEGRGSRRCVFLLGYEEARMRRAFEELQVIEPTRTSLVFGVPAFKAGWEMDSIANNIAVIREQNIAGGIYYCGAENPAAVGEVLDGIHNALQTNERLFVAPIGTKPHGIGVALFVSKHPNVGVLYDHPRRASGRTSKLGNWHLYTVEADGCARP